MIQDTIYYDTNSGDFTWLEGRRKGMKAGWLQPDGYICIQINGKTYPAHVLAFLWMGEKRPPQIDHINRNKSDNRWINLRPSNNSLNQVNTDSRLNKTGFRGVRWVNKIQRYRARLAWRDGSKHKSKELGYFDNPLDAHQAYLEAAKERYGKNLI